MNEPRGLSLMTDDRPPNPCSTVNGFVRLAMAGDWQRKLWGLIQRLCLSGLYERTTRLHVVLTDNPRDEAFSSYGKVEFASISGELPQTELGVLEQVRQFCATNAGLVYYLDADYFCDTAPDAQHPQECFAIERYADCIDALAKNDVCVDQEIDQSPATLARAAFWARAEYVRMLESASSAGVVEADSLGSSRTGGHWIRSGRSVRVSVPNNSCQRADVLPRMRREEERCETTRMNRRWSSSTAKSSIRRKVDMPIYGFMHVAMHAHWREIVAEQIIKLKASGLWAKTARIFVGLLGPDRAAFNLSDPKLQVVHYHAQYDDAELPTLSALQSFCTSNDCLVYYVHTNGVFRQGQGQEDWRRCMEHFVLTRYQDCIVSLAENDVCGINWVADDWCNHFSGNFWWARSDYIRTLPDIRRLDFLPGLDGSPRHICERWIGENPSVRAACLHNTYAHHYTQEYPRSRYARLPEVVLDKRFRASAWSGLENRFQDLLEPIHPIQRIVDVGVEWGFSMMCFARCLPHATVIGVDPYQAAPVELHARSATLGGQGILGSAEAENWVSQHLLSFPNAILLRTTSAAAAAVITGPIDVVHIDALHTYSDVAQDFAYWEPKVRPGGCVLFHDTESFPQDVGKFFNELGGRKASIRECHGLGAWYKPGPASSSGATGQRNYCR